MLALALMMPDKSIVKAVLCCMLEGLIAVDCLFRRSAFTPSYNDMECGEILCA